MRAPTVSRLRQLVRAGLAATLPRRLYLVRGPRRARTICLTFDDGPHPVYTPQYLDLLAAHRVRATFFLIGQNAERHPDLVKRIIADGHAVGNHSYSHPRREELSARAMAEDIRRGAEVIREICGTSPTLYRPPRGAVTARDFWFLGWSGRTVVLWNQDPKDFSRQNSEEVVDWFRARPPAGGDVVLLHDVHPFSLAALPEVISSARQRNIGFSTIRDWIG